MNQYHLLHATPCRCGHRGCSSVIVAGQRFDAETGERIVNAVNRWEALMRVARIRMMGSAGFDRETGEKRDGGWVHFGAEFWSVYPGFPKELEEENDQTTTWGRRALEALTDDVIAHELNAFEIAKGLSKMERHLLLDQVDGWKSWMWDVASGLVVKGIGRRDDSGIKFDTPLAKFVLRILHRAHEFRCVNCKLVVKSPRPPEQCSECKGKTFAEIDEAGFEREVLPELAEGMIG